MRARLEVKNIDNAVIQVALTNLRTGIGQHSLDEVLKEQETVSNLIQQKIDHVTEPWGVKVSKVEVKQVDIPEQMQRAIARQAEAERERRAKIIHAEGEYEASQKLADAAKVLETQTSASAISRRGEKWTCAATQP